MRTVLFATFALLLVVPAHALPASPNPALSQAASDVLDAAVQDAYATAGKPETKSIPQALEARAYMSALSLIAEHTTYRLQEEMWEAAQAAPSPPDAFMESVFNVGKQARDILDANLTRLEAATAPQVGAATAARLAAAAELMVQGESDLTLASRFFGGSLRREDVSYPSQRYTVLLPAMKALIHARAGSVVLDGLAADGGEANVDTQALAATIKARGGSGTTWQLDLHGPFHELARHVRIYAATRPNATIADLEGTIGLLDTAFKGPRDPAGAVLASARLDGAWWVARAAQEGTNPLWGLTITFLNSRASSAIYAQSLLDSTVEGGVEWSVWALGGAAVAAAAAVALALWRRRGRARSTAVLLVLTLAFAPALLPSASAHGDGADHVQTRGGPPANVQPLPQEPVPYTRPMRAAYGGLAAAPDGTLHFAWVGCVGQPTTGCFNVYHRTLNGATGEWSAPQLVADPPENATMARVVLAGSEVHIAWVQGTGDEAGEPVEFAHCLLRPFPCDSATRISTYGQFASGSDIVTNGERVFAVWSEEEVTGLAKVYGRWWRDGAWGTPIVLSAPTRVARYPDATLDPSGIAHVVWQGDVVSSRTSNRVLDYAAVGLEGVVDGPMTLSTTPVDYRVRPSIDVQPHGTVGIAYNGYRDLFVIERPAGGRDWTSAVNVTRTRWLSQSWPVLSAHGSDWVVTWVTGTIGQFHMWQTQRDEGFWLRPDIVVGAPYDGLLLLPQATVANGDLHVVWTANSTGTLDMEMLYGAWPADRTFTTPPEVWSVTPSEGAWVRGPVAQLSALIASAAPVGPDGVLWEVDGNALTTTVGGDGKVRAEAHLADGPHTARLQVEDARGGRVERTVEFTVDSVAPSFTTTVRVGGQVVANAAGWYSTPVTVEGTPFDDDGAPVGMQVDYNGVGSWGNMDGPLPIPANFLITVRLRAIDDAGNVALGSPMSLGWDTTAPNVTLAMPRWSSGAATPVPIARGDTGSPITVELSVRKASGEPVGVSQQPLEKLMLPVLAEGSYSVHAKATDAVGLTQDVGTWDLGVDPQAPTASVQGGALRLQDRGASGLLNVTFLVPGQAATVLTLDGQEATVARSQLPGGVANVELVLRDQAGNQWHGTADLVSGKVEEVVLGVQGTQTSRRSPAPAAAFLGLALLAFCARRRKATAP